MTQAAAISEARQLIKQRSDDVESAYAKLVDDLAASVDVMPETVVETLEKSGRSFADLEGDLDRVESRIAAKLEADKLPAAERRLAEIQGEQATLTAELAAVQHRVRAKCDLLRDEMNALQVRIATLAEHRHKLATGVFDSPAQKLRQKQLNAELKPIVDQMNEDRSELRRWEISVVSEQRNISQYKKGDAPGSLGVFKSKLAHAQQRVAGLKANLDRLQAEYDRLQAAGQQLILERVS